MVLDLLWSTSWEYYRIYGATLIGIGQEYYDPKMSLKGPSWSWASTTAAVQFEPTTDDWLRGQCATIKDIRCEMNGSNPFGEVTLGLLQIAGRLKRMDFYTGELQNPYHYPIQPHPNDFLISIPFLRGPH
jgi:hypothetical protein